MHLDIPTHVKFVDDLALAEIVQTTNIVNQVAMYIHGDVVLRIQHCIMYYNTFLVNKLSIIIII